MRNTAQGNSEEEGIVSKGAVIYKQKNQEQPEKQMI
jgi:hypothetical protein